MGARTVALGPGGEFDLIRRFLLGAGDDSPEVVVGSGDDAAVLHGGWVVSTDLSVEDVHFRRAWLRDEEVGFRAAAAALSDLAAMAATPVGVLVSMAFPEGGRWDLERVQAGVREAAAEVGTSVIGGDLSRSPGPLVLDVTVVGHAPSPALRVGAAAGDEVWVTGSLGASAAAVKAWEAGQEPAPALRAAFARPTPRIAAAAILARHGALHALVDLSDGLAGDAGHLAAAGASSVVLELGRIPVAPAARAALGDRDAMDAALHGGEDYELCFAAPPGAVTTAVAEAVGLTLTRVGHVEEGDGVWLEDATGGRVRPDRGGFDHTGAAE
ncbi:MAG TPA: thiamine-phosphate kinase [Longimicrobiales bacterium]|nr:thiamine-phosphate kinase [Longimicrobiales bacterium]